MASQALGQSLSEPWLIRHHAGRRQYWRRDIGRSQVGRCQVRHIRRRDRGRRNARRRHHGRARRHGGDRNRRQSNRRDLNRRRQRGDRDRRRRHRRGGAAAGGQPWPTFAAHIAARQTSDHRIFMQLSFRARTNLHGRTIRRVNETREPRTAARWPDRPRFPAAKRCSRDRQCELLRSATVPVDSLHSMSRKTAWRYPSRIRPAPPPLPRGEAPRPAAVRLEARSAPSSALVAAQSRWPARPRPKCCTKRRSTHCTSRSHRNRWNSRGETPPRGFPRSSRPRSPAPLPKSRFAS